MTGKEVETVATLLKRVRERADDVLNTTKEWPNIDAHDLKQIAVDTAKGMQSLAAAVEMVTIELAELRRRFETHRAVGAVEPRR